MYECTRNSITRNNRKYIHIVYKICSSMRGAIFLTATKNRMKLLYNINAVFLL